MLGTVGDVVGGAMDFIGGFFPHSPAERGPFSGEGWRAVGEGGEALIEQFAGGIDTSSYNLSFGALPPMLTNIQGGSTMPDNMRLVVDGYEFNAYVDTRADGRVKSYDEAELRATRGGSRVW